MEYIDLHAHMVSRTTDDYRAMAMSGCVAVTEPAFRAGYDRPGVEARQLDEAHAAAGPCASGGRRRPGG